MATNGLTPKDLANAVTRMYDDSLKGGFDSVKGPLFPIEKVEYLRSLFRKDSTAILPFFYQTQRHILELSITKNLDSEESLHLQMFFTSIIISLLTATLSDPESTRMNHNDLERDFDKPARTRQPEKPYVNNVPPEELPSSEELFKNLDFELPDWKKKL